MKKVTKKLFKRWLDKDGYDGEGIKYNEMPPVSVIQDVVVAAYQRGETDHITWDEIRHTRLVKFLALASRGDLTSVRVAFDTAARLCYLQRHGILFIPEKGDK